MEHNKELNTKKQCDIHVVINWVACKDALPVYGETVLTYTPKTQMADEQHRLIKYGSLKSGFPAGITHWKSLDKPPCI
jgi:hypothetical protein